MPSDSGSKRAASGGALERRKMATARRTRTAATMRSVLRVRRCISAVRITVPLREEPSCVFRRLTRLLLCRFLLKLRVQVNRAAGDVEGLGPVGKALLLDDNFMAAGSHCEGRRRVADKCAVDFYVGSGWSGVDGQRGLSGGSRSAGLFGRRRGCGGCSGIGLDFGQ